jgi:hypothetical protein
VILNVFALLGFGQPCSRCGTKIIECEDDQGIHAFLNGLPDPLGKYRVAFRRGDHGENLFHYPGLGMKGEAYYHAILIARYHGSPLYSIHRCTG